MWLEERLRMERAEVMEEAIKGLMDNSEYSYEEAKKILFGRSNDPNTDLKKMNL